LDLQHPPYIEQQSLRELGQGMAPTPKSQAMLRAVQMPLSILKCPTRPSPSLAPSRPSSIMSSSGDDYTIINGVLVARNDYAVNEGDFYLTTAPIDPKTPTWTTYSTGMNGICYQRSQLQPASIKDGLSQTYLLGEKFVSSMYYDNWSDLGYDQNMFCGDSLDIGRWVLATPLQDCNEPYSTAYG
jgi:hypothetical protein